MKIAFACSSTDDGVPFAAQHISLSLQCITFPHLMLIEKCFNTRLSRLQMTHTVLACSSIDDDALFAARQLSAGSGASSMSGSLEWMV